MYGGNCKKTSGCKGVIPSSQVTSAGLYALWRVYDITYAETFEYRIKQNRKKKKKFKY